MSVPTSSSGVTYPVIEGYRIVQLIGGGGFSKVFRAVNSQADRHPIAAIKVVSYAPSPNRHPVDRRALQKEVQIHSILKHANVLEFIIASEVKSPRHVPGLYMVLELGAGGDLFDKIAPDYGVEEDLAHFYFSQLVFGLEYIHSQGVAHRDIKPENLLLDHAGNLKLADFGLCSVYKYKGREREMNGACGSLPYIAPEMNGKPYRGEPVDVWSSGVVLFALLVGNSPWDEPTSRSPEYVAYLSGELFRHDPWTRLSRDTLSILTKLLTVDPTKRLTLDQIKRHRWFSRPNKLLTDGTCNDPISLAERLLRGLALGDLLHSDGGRAEVPETVSHTQPEGIQRNALNIGPGRTIPTSSAGPVISDRTRAAISQHTNNGGSQFALAINAMTQWSSMAGSQRRFAPQLTRFFASLDAREVTQRIVAALQNESVQNSVEPLGEDPARTIPDTDGGDGDTEMAESQDSEISELSASSSSNSLSSLPESIGTWGARIRVFKMDSRKCALRGEIRIEVLSSTDFDKAAMPPPSVIPAWNGNSQAGNERKSPKCVVLMRRSKGSPLEWRRLFISISRRKEVAEVILS